MKNKLRRWLPLALLSGLGIAGLYTFIRPEPLAVETAAVKSGPMQVSVSAEGRTRVRDRFVVSSPIDGRLGRIQVREGDSVRRGSVLTWFTPAPLEIRSERQRQAALQAAEAEEKSAQAQVVQARLNLEQAGRDLRRVSSLVEGGVRPAQDLDSARTTESTAREALNSATSMAAAAAFHVEEVRSSLIISDTQAIALRSPVNGLILRIDQQSERVVSSGTPILTIGDPARIELMFDVLSTDAMRIKTGASVIVQNWGNGETAPAVVRTIEPGAFTKVSALGVEEQRVNVIAEFCDVRPALGDGYRVDGEIAVWEAKSVMQVPVSALFRVGADWNVFVVNGEKIFLRTVQIGQRNQRNAEVLHGLSEGELVVLYPDDRLNPGMRVKSDPKP